MANLNGLKYHFKTYFPNKGHQGSFKGWLILGLGKEIHKLKLRHLVLPENKEVLKTHNDGSILHAHRGQLKNLPTANAVTI